MVDLPFNNNIMFVYSFIAEDMFPENATQDDYRRKDRFSAYRSIVFWLFSGLKKRDRRALPACVYQYVRKKFPFINNNNDDDDEPDSLLFSKFVSR